MTEIKTVEKSIVMADNKPFVVLPLNKFDELTKTQKAIEQILKSDKAICCDRFYLEDTGYSTYVLYSDDEFKSVVKYWHKRVDDIYNLNKVEDRTKVRSYRTVAIITSVIAIGSIITQIYLLLK